MHWIGNIVGQLASKQALWIAVAFGAAITSAAQAEPGSKVVGDLMQWHKVTVEVQGPTASETDEVPNPFTDYRFEVEFTHEASGTTFRVPGYFAADGDAANSSATSGNVWRAHLAPDHPGLWKYAVYFELGPRVAIDHDKGGLPVEGVDGLSGEFEIAASNKMQPDFRARGRLQYVGKHHLQFAGDGTFFLKAGPDAPETLLAYRDFDDTKQTKNRGPLKSWQPHVQDWREGDPTWKDGLGKGLIGAVNYLAAQGMNTMSFLPYNAGGDGDNVWPFVSRDDKFHYDCSKLDQWGVVFDHATANGIYLHFKLQETEMDDNRRPGDNNHRDTDSGGVPESLDGGQLGPERKLYLRELVARFGHALALNWNLGEENTQSPDEVRAMAEYIREIDPYDHHIVIHTFPNEQDKVYPPLLGDGSVLTGASLQNSWRDAHRRTAQWTKASAASGRPWVVANDEQGPASMGVPPDPGYEGHSGEAKEGDTIYTMHDVRQRTLWGTLMAGGAGVEYYFGYQLPQNDLRCEDFRSRRQSWKYCRIALEFFRDHQIPFQNMACADEFVGNTKHDNSRYCLTDSESVYLVYLPAPQDVQLDLSAVSGEFDVRWFDPTSGGPPREGSQGLVSAGSAVDLGNPPTDENHDWLIILRRK